MMKHISLQIVRGTIVLAALHSFILGQAQAQELKAGDIIPGEVIVSVSEIAPLSKRDVAQFEAVTGKDLAPVDKDSHAVLLADPAATGDSEPLCNRYHRKLRGFKAQLKKVGSHRALPLVKCSPNIVVAATALPNDPSFTSLWGMNQSSNIDINAPEAWDQSTGSSSVVVAVIDSGVDYNHPDLAANMWTNPNEIPGNGIDDDGNGYIDDIHGINAITNSGNPMDDFGHGTHVSGTIAGVGNNGVGVTGVSWRSKIIGVKFLASNGYGSLMDSIKALDYVSALKNSGVNIVATSNSWGYAGGSYQPLEDAIARSKNAGILFIAAAGNNSANCDTTGFYPGNSPQSNVISVAAVDQSGNLASFSNYGAMNVDLGAPGVHIASTYPQNQYVWMDGTSMATPHVSGAAALIKSAYPNLTWQQIKDAILGSVSPLSSLSGKTSTGGMLNLQNAFAQLGPLPPVVPTTVPSPTPTPTATLTPTPVNTPTPTMTPTITPTPGIYTVSGEVRTADGIIVTGARVELTTTTGQSYVVTTGAGGRFNFAAMRGGFGYTIVVTRVGYSFNPQTGSLWSDATHDFVALQNSYNINMKAISARDGTVIPSGMSFAISINGGSPQPLTQNSYGVATLGAAYGTRYTITASGPGYTCDSILNAEVWGDVTRVLGCSLN